MLNYYGFEVKYCIPNNIVGKNVRQASFYYNKKLIYQYHFSPKTNYSEFIFNNQKEEKEIQSFLSKNANKLGVSNIVDLTIRMFQLLEAEHAVKIRKQEGKAGVLAVTSNDLREILVLSPIDKKYSINLFETIKNMYHGKKYVFYSSTSQFVFS